MKERKYFNNQLKKDPITHRPYCEGKKVEDESKLIIEFLERQYQLSSLYNSFSVEDGIKWLYGFANFINVKAKKRRPNQFHKHSYVPGRLVMLDFFGGFGTELIYDHPAIVLFDTGDGLIVAPLTSNKDTYKDAINNPFHIRLPKNVALYGNLKENSTIKLEQLRFVSKYRILRKLNRVSDKPKLNEIEGAISELLAKYTNLQKDKTIASLTTQLESLEIQRSSLEEEKTILNNEIATLKNNLNAITEERDKLILKIESSPKLNDSTEHIKK